MTALTLTDEGPHVSTELAAVSISEAQESVQSVFTSSIRQPPTSLPPRELSRSSLPRTTAYALPTKPMHNTARRAQDVLSSIESDLHAVADSLDFSAEGAFPAEAVLRPILDNAAENVTKLGSSLNGVSSQSFAILENKTKLRTQLRELDGRITLLGTSLLSPQENTKPLAYDAGTCSPQSSLKQLTHFPG